MSEMNNTEILERASSLLDEITGHPSRLDVALEKAIEANDLDYARMLIGYIENELAQTAFREDDMGVY